MSALQTYSEGAIFLNGILIAEAINIEGEHVTNNKEIITITKGFSGVSPGAQMFRATIGAAIPRAGTDVDYTSIFQGITIVELVIYARSKKLKSKGYIMGARETYGADRAAEQSLTYVGTPIEETTA